MSNVIRPVGPQDPSVYWRRRLAVLLALVAVVAVTFLIVRLFTGGDDDAGTSADGGASAGETTSAEDAGDPTDDATSTASASQSPTATSTDGAPACAAADLQISATADASSYAAGSQPKFGLLIRNVGQAACFLDSGSAAVEYLIVSGEDRIWSSDDCQTDAVSSVRTVEPGGELASSVTWPMQRSAEGCPTGLPEPRPGTYQLTGQVGDFTSEPLVFSIT